MRRVRQLGQCVLGAPNARVVLLMCGLLACSGQIEEVDGAGGGRRDTRGMLSGGSRGGSGVTGNDGPGSVGDGANSGSGPGAGPRVDLPMDPDELAQVPLSDVAASVSPSPETRLPRLTHVQWQNSVRDLLFLASDATLPVLRPDPVSAGFDFTNSGATLEVDAFLHDGYQQAAEDLAGRVTADPTLLEKILPAGSRDATTGPETFIRGFGLRAHRRPLADEELEAYLALYAEGARHYPSLSAFEAGVRVLLEAFLQSPYFLYRWEPSEAVSGDLIPLGDYEVASRLSFTLWDSMPDDALFAAAEAGELVLPEGVAEQVQRMLDDPRAQPVVESFHAQLMNSSKYDLIAPSTSVFPDVPADLGQSARQELASFVRDVAFTKERGYRELLTSTETFVNADLARLYGVSGTFGDAFVKVQLDPSERKGLLTQVGFLAAHATSADADPIKRGVFVAERIACLHISSPNDASPPPQPMPGSTNRQLIESHTEMPGSACAGCHAPLINPFGFPFENYDATGAFRTTDNGFTVDASASPLIDDTATPVENALELIDALAQSPQVHACYARHWLEFMHGRHVTDVDEPLATRIGFESQSAAELSIKELVETVASSRAFLNRSTEEAP